MSSKTSTPFLVALVAGLGVAGVAVGSAAAAVIQGSHQAPQLAPLAIEPASATAIPPMPTTTTLDAFKDPTALAAIAAAKRAAAAPASPIAGTTAQTDVATPAPSPTLPVSSPAPARTRPAPVVAPTQPVVPAPVATVVQRPAPVPTSPAPTTTTTAPTGSCTLALVSADSSEGVAIFTLATSPEQPNAAVTMTLRSGASSVSATVYATDDGGKARPWVQISGLQLTSNTPSITATASFANGASCSTTFLYQ